MCRTSLDDLVLSNCASQLHFIDRIFHEGVSCRFASILKSTYALDEIHLKINNTDGSSFYLPKLKDVYTLSDAKQRNNPALSGTSDNSLRQYLTASEENLRYALILILSRYKRLRCMKLTGKCGKHETDCILAILQQEPCNIRTLRRLEYRPSNFEIDAQLIEYFSSTLRSLTMRSHMSPPSQWEAVAKCTNLKTLSYLPESFSHYIPRSLRMCRDHFLICIKQLQLKTFRIRFQSGSRYFDADWLAAAFEENQRLRKLIIHSTDSLPNVFSAPKMLPIIRRLRTIAMDFCSIPTEEACHDLEIVTQNLAKESYLTVQHDLRTEAEMKVVPEVEVADSVLQFWLRLSDHTSRTIHLTIKHSVDDFDLFTDQVFLTLTKNPEFAGISVERIARMIILKFCSAKVVLHPFHRVYMNL